MLLALTPAHFMFSRLALDYQAPLPFILGWLFCVLTYCRRGQPRHLFAAGLLLGFGLYTYIAADVLMPLYALLTCIVLYTRRTPAAGGYAFLAAGFVLPAMIGGLFLLRHPTIIRDVMLRYEPGQAHVVPTLSTVQTFIRSRHLADAMSVMDVLEPSTVVHQWPNDAHRHRQRLSTRRGRRSCCRCGASALPLQRGVRSSAGAGSSLLRFRPAS